MIINILIWSAIAALFVILLFYFTGEHQHKVCKNKLRSSTYLMQMNRRRILEIHGFTETSFALTSFWGLVKVGYKAHC